MDSRLESFNFDEIRQDRIDVAQKLMSIFDEDGQPMYNQDWIEKNILGTTEENYD